MAVSNWPIPIRLTLCFPKKLRSDWRETPISARIAFCFLRAAQAAEFGDELPNRPVLPETPITRDMG